MSIFQVEMLDAVRQALNHQQVDPIIDVIAPKYIVNYIYIIEICTAAGNT